MRDCYIKYFIPPLLTGNSSTDLGVLTRSNVQPGRLLGEGIYLEPWRIRKDQKYGKGGIFSEDSISPELLSFSVCTWKTHPLPGNRAPVSPNKGDYSLVRQFRRKHTNTCGYNFGWPGNNFQRGKVVRYFCITPIWWNMFHLLKVSIDGREVGVTELRLQRRSVRQWTL